MVHLIMESYSWKNTVIMLTYDEGGGFYDQVAPPTVAGHQLGFRVPYIIISPYAKENYVSDTIMSHTSILGFIDYNWNMPALNNLVLHSNLPLDMFNFNNSYANGVITRIPFIFNATLQQFISAGQKDNTKLAGSFANVGNVFPGTLQFDVSTLPYNISGQSNFSLANTSSTVFVPVNYIFTHWYLQPYIILPVATVSFGLLGFRIYHLVKRRIKRRRKKKSNGWP